MTIESELLISRIANATPNDGTASNRLVTFTTEGKKTGKVKVCVPSTGSKLWIKFSDDPAAAINATSAATLRAETSARVLEVGEKEVLNTEGKQYAAIYSAAAWEVNFHEVKL